MNQHIYLMPPTVHLVLLTFSPLLLHSSDVSKN
jgi:hypothetical protein